ncbi:hypothetical protein Tco_1086705 [Tanacetum coccineum]
MSMAEICYPCVGFVAVVKRSWPDPFSDHGLLEFVRRSFLFVTAMWVRCRQIKVLVAGECIRCRWNEVCAAVHKGKRIVSKDTNEAV